MLRGLVRLAAVLLVVGVAAAAFGWHLYTKPGPLPEARAVVVAKGGARAVAEQLAQAGVIAHQVVFVAAAKLAERQGPLKAGEYQFPPAISVRDAVALLQSGKTVVRRFTVAEGLTVVQVVALLAGAEGMSGDITTLPAEGSLLPQTYHYSWGDGRAEMLKRMEEAMRRTLDELWAQRSGNLPLASKEEALVLASIVERETGVPEERPRVAAVFLNRLRQGMKLQSDPTVIYGLSGGSGVLDHPLTRAELADPTPYNTYVHEGLPPTPIANPGVASLAAVLKPLDSDDLYFVADGSGGHAFAKTLADHNKNVAKWRQIERKRQAEQAKPASDDAKP